MTLPEKMFVTGTNTDIGKTVTSGVLVEGLKAHYWKPVQTGLDDGTDTDWIIDHTSTPSSRIHEETYRFKAPLSPHAAAALENAEIDLDAFALPSIPPGDSLIVEGAGGVMVPLNKQYFMLDLINVLALPVVLVVDSELGTTNHTLLSVIQLQKHGIPIAGIVMNGPKNQGNRDAIEFYGKVPVLAEIEPLPESTPEALADCFQRCFS